MEHRTYSAALLLALLLPLFGLSQTGPGGVGGNANNVLWLSADRGVFNNAGITPAANGDNVQQWNDRSGNAKNASEGTLANRPNYHTNVLNGHPVIRYTAANTDRMLATGLISTNTASVWVVASYSSLPSNNPGLFQGSASGLGYSNNTADKNIGMWVNNTSRQPWGRGIQTDNTALNIPQNTTTNAGTVYILNNNYGATTINQYVNNTAAGSVATNGTLKSWTDLAIGCQGGNESWNGDIAEVIAFNISLNNTQRILVANYLAAKYGLTLGTTDIYTQDNAGQGNYDHEVAGIGRISATDLSNDGQGSGVVRISNPSDLGNNEFLIWGHDNGALGVWGVTDLPAGLQGRWARTWRVSEVNQGGAAVNVGAVDMTFDLSGQGSVTASHLRLLVDTDNDGVFADETPISGATHVSGALYRFSGVTALVNNRRFTLGTTNYFSTPLPVELLSFKALAVGSHATRLEWVTATERDNAYFTVERSTDMTGWQPVVQVVGAGNSQEQLSYWAMDEAAPQELLYYRLRQTDLDGTSTLSEVAVVDLSTTVSLDPVLFPNPAQGEVQLVFPELHEDALNITILDPAGRVVRALMLPGGQFRYTADLIGLPPGLYHIHIQAGGHYMVRSLVVTP